jgi:hypothetical protein
MEILFRPSEVDPLLSKPKGKSNADIYQETTERLAKYEDEYDSLKNKDTKKALKLASDIERYKAIVAEQDQLKDLPHLSVGAMQLCKAKMIEILYGRREQFENKYTTKGKDQEEASITLYSVMKNRVFENNKARVSNDYFTGEIDIPWYDRSKIMVEITDVKTSYSIHTFFANEDTIKRPNRSQGVAYLDLHPTVKKYNIANLLVNNSFDSILSILHRESYSWQDGDIPHWREIQIIKEHIFDQESFEMFCKQRFFTGLDEIAQKEYDSFVEVPIDVRLIEHSFNRDDNEINELKAAVDNARVWMRMMYGL